MKRLLVWCMVMGAVSAAPMLRLSNSVLTAYASPGASPPNQTLAVTNAGDGTLNASVSISPEATWLSGAYCAACHYVQFAFSSIQLPAGTYTAQVTVSDPNAVDSPQVVIVTLQIGVNPIVEYMAPGTTLSIPVPGVSGICFSCASIATTTSGGGKWLSMSVAAEATIFYYTAVTLNPPASMAPGTYTGSVTIGPPFSESFSVTMNLTTLPIAVPSTNQISLRLAQNGPAVTYPFLPYVSLSNSGMGTLQVTGVSGSGTGVSAYNYQGLAIITVNPGSLAPGVYNDGVVTIQCNAANCPLQVPVNLEVDPQGPPIVHYQGAVDNATFSPAGSPGDVMIVKGQQLSSQPPQYASGGTLPTTLGGASVLVNGVATPLYYSSSGQIAFQARADTYLGLALVQVVRDDQPGNTVSVTMQQYTPGIVTVTDASYNLLDATHPAKPGQTLVFWALGLGPTSPSVADGSAAPSNPPAIVTIPVTVEFGLEFFTSAATPTFAGLSPGSVGLYQVIATLPATTPSGTVSASFQLPGGVRSNSVTIAVQ